MATLLAFIGGFVGFFIDMIVAVLAFYLGLISLAVVSILTLIF